MIAKIKKRNDFQGVVEYQIDYKKQAKILDSEGVRLADNNSIIDSFNMQLALNPKIKKPVYHISLDFSEQDKTKLSDTIMTEIAREYMKEMGIINTQYITVRHFDKEHPHLHLCINRIDNEGRLISDDFDLSRSTKICKILTKKYNLHFAKGKDNVKRHRLCGADKVKYEIYDTLVSAVLKVRSWEELEKELNKHEINLILKNKGKTNEIRGVVFSKNSYYFTGSKIDRRFSYSNIAQQLGSEERVHNRESQKDRYGFDSSGSNILKDSINTMLSILSMGDKDNSESIDNKNNLQRKKKGFKR